MRKICESFGENVNILDIARYKSRRWWGCFNFLSHVASARCEPSTLLTQKHRKLDQNTSTHCSLAPWYSDTATLECFSSYIRRHNINGRCFLRPRKRSQAKSKEALTWEPKKNYLAGFLDQNRERTTYWINLRAQTWNFWEFHTWIGQIFIYLSILQTFSNCKRHLSVVIQSG